MMNSNDSNDCTYSTNRFDIRTIITLEISQYYEKTIKIVSL